VKIKLHRFGLPGEEPFPRRHVSVQTTRQERRGVHRTSECQGHGWHEFPRCHGHGLPLTIGRSVHEVPLHRPCLPSSSVSLIPASSSSRAVAARLTSPPSRHRETHHCSM
jgi:hypothetical protein